LGGLFKDSKSIKKKSGSLQSDGFTTFIPTIGDGLMYQFQQWGDLPEKKLTDTEVDELIKRSEVTVNFVLHDDSKTKKEREQGRKDLELIKVVKDTWKKNSLHPNFVSKVMKVITGIYQKVFFV